MSKARDAHFMKLSEAQMRHIKSLVLSNKPQTLLHGPIGTAKTTAGCLWLLAESSRMSGCQLGLLGYTEQQALGGPVNELMKLCPGVKRVNARKYLLPSAVGAPNRLLVFTARQQGDSDRIRSYNLAGGYVDELTEIPEDAYAAFIGRMRVGENPRVVSTTNPKGKSHWVYRKFFKPGTPQTEQIQTHHSDNPSLPSGYYENIKSAHSGHELARMVYGEWIDVAGIAFPHCLKAVTNAEPAYEDIVRLDIGMDVGWSSVSHAVVLATDKDGVVWVVDEWVHDHRKRGKLSSHQKAAAALGALYDTDFPIGLIVIDRSATEVIDAMIPLARQIGAEVHNAYDQFDGVQICEEWAQLGGLRICKQYAPVLCKELERVVWDERKASYGIDALDDKIPRHGLDALRYVVAKRHIIEFGGQRQWETRKRWTYAIQ